MAASFLADADLRLKIVVGLKRVEPKVDFRTAQQAFLSGVPDLEVLRIAAELDCVLVSHDRSTMPGMFYEFIREHHSPGLILIAQSAPIGRVIDDLRLCYQALTKDEFANRIHYLPLQKG